MWYILYPKNHSDKIKLTNKRPKASVYSKKYGFAEGPFKNLKSVKTHLNWMNIPSDRRPKNLE